MRTACVRTNSAVVIALGVVTPTSEHWLITLISLLSAMMSTIVEQTGGIAGPRRLRMLLDRLKVRRAMEAGVTSHEAL